MFSRCLIITAVALIAVPVAAARPASVRDRVASLEEGVVKAPSRAEAKRRFLAMRDALVAMSRDVEKDPNRYSDEDQTFVLGLDEMLSGINPDLHDKAACEAAKRHIVFGYAPQAERWDDPVVLKDLPDEVHVALRLVCPNVGSSS